MANFEAAYDGRSPLVGKSWDANYGEADQTAFPIGIEQIKNIFSLFSSFLQKTTSKRAPREGLYLETDEQGYRHFSPSAKQEGQSSSLSGVLGDLSDAIRKDWNYFNKE